jgi:hypothetical protein
MPMYLRCATIIQKQVSRNILFFAVDITFFIANVSDFTSILLVKLKTLSSHISTENYAMLLLLDNKNYLF